jgi:hypothetical protein
MKYIYFFLATMIMTVYAFAQTATAPAGAGTVGNPYQIETLANLYWMGASNAVVPSPTFATRIASTTYYIQTANIDASSTSSWNSGAGWIPIAGQGSGTSYNAQYNGGNYTISGLFINRPTEDLVGWIGQSGWGTNISNLGLTDVNITGKGYVGAIAGVNDGGTSSYTNCYTTGSVNSVEGSNVGGFIGNASSATLTNCYSTCTVTVTGVVNNQGYYVGGFCGTINNTIASGRTVTNCYATGNVTSYQRYVGGFVGNLTNNAPISNCYATGNAYSTTRSVGGFAGIININAVSLCYSTGNATGQFQAGGFAGETTAASTITNCYSFGNATRTTGTDANFGGFIGLNRSTVTNCFSTGSVIYTGGSNPTDKGFIGVNTGGSYSNNFYDSQVSNQTSATGATATTTANMKTQSTFTGAGWDFIVETDNGTNDYWEMNSGFNEGYPILSWQSVSVPTITTTPNIVSSSNIGFTAQSGSVSLGFVVMNSIPANLPGGAVTINKYWEISDVTGGSIKLRLYYLPSQTASFTGTPKIYHYDGTSWVLLPTEAEVIDGLKRYVETTNYYSSFSPVIVGDDNSPLPVELTSFTAKLINKNVNLNWQTATEVNNYGFEIERKIVGTSRDLSEIWETISFIKGNGNSNSPKEYSFTDKTITEGKYSYRLKQIDNDGKFTYSGVVDVDIENIPTDYALYQNYPNPFNPSTTIKFGLLQDGIVILEVYNLVGEKVATLVNEELTAGYHTIDFNGSRLSSGIYLYKLSSGEFTSTKKFVLMK